MREHTKHAMQPSWPARTGAPRVLIEDDDGATAWASTEILRRAGFDVARCGGPAELPGSCCRLVSTGRCALAEDADVIVDLLRLSVPENREVIQALRAHLSATPIVVEASPDDTRKYAETLAGCHLAPFPMTARALVEAVAAASDARGAGFAP